MTCIKFAVAFFALGHTAFSQQESKGIDELSRSIQQGRQSALQLIEKADPKTKNENPVVAKLLSTMPQLKVIVQNTRIKFEESLSRPAEYDPTNDRILISQKHLDQEKPDLKSKKLTEMILHESAHKLLASKSVDNNSEEEDGINNFALMLTQTKERSSKKGGGFGFLKNLTQHGVYRPGADWCSVEIEYDLTSGHLWVTGWGDDCSDHFTLLYRCNSQTQLCLRTITGATKPTHFTHFEIQIFENSFILKSYYKDTSITPTLTKYFYKGKSQ